VQNVGAHANLRMGPPAASALQKKWHRGNSQEEKAGKQEESALRLSSHSGLWQVSVAAVKRKPDFSPPMQSTPPPQRAQSCGERKLRRLLPTPLAGPAFEAEHLKRQRWGAALGPSTEPCAQKSIGERRDVDVAGPLAGCQSMPRMTMCRSRAKVQNHQGQKTLFQLQRLPTTVYLLGMSYIVDLIC
jgi:hypothetical protein